MAGKTKAISGRRSVTRKRRAGFRNPAVAAAFKAWPPALREKLLALRQLILDTAAATNGVGDLDEALKWGQPSYLTTASKSGSTIRIGEVKGQVDRYAVYFHCQTNLVATFRELYPTEMSYGGNRSIILDAHDRLPVQALRHCVALALTYHLGKQHAAHAPKRTVRPGPDMSQSRRKAADRL